MYSELWLFSAALELIVHSCVDLTFRNFMHRGLWQIL